MFLTRLFVVLICLFPIVVYSQQITPHSQNPYYWEYKGSPVLLLGGSSNDNLFQSYSTSELNTIKNCGGNYVRNTMSSRDDGNIWPYNKSGNVYNLNSFNSSYWNKFENFLQECENRNIIVQIEVWATYDYYKSSWDRNPFNPKNNSNYTSSGSGLPEVVDWEQFSATGPQPFFKTVPELNNNTTVLKYQQAFIDKILSYSLNHQNVLYCIDNETEADPKWGKYWSNYIDSKADSKGKTVHTTEMWDDWNITSSSHLNSIDHPEVYDFLDVSQNNWYNKDLHQDRIAWVRNRISSNKRPVNNVKVYGRYRDDNRIAHDHSDGGRDVFWLCVFAGCASARFHRNMPGYPELGITTPAQNTIKAVRDVTNALDIFSCSVRNDLLSSRSSGEAFCLANPGSEYAVYFSDGGNVTLDVSATSSSSTLAIKWYNVGSRSWNSPITKSGGGNFILNCSGSGKWAVVITATQGPVDDIPPSAPSGLSITNEMIETMIDF